MDTNKRKAESLDSDPNKELKIYSNIYFEPKYVCDIELVYQNTIFHSHKYILIEQSKYFETTFQLDQDCKRIDIPELKSNLLKEPIDIEHVEQWIGSLYSSFKTRATPPPKCILSYSHLLNYFQCDTLQAYFESANYNIRSNQDCVDILKRVLVAIEYKWKSVTTYISLTSRKLNDIIKRFDEPIVSDLWSSIPLEWERKIYLVNFPHQSNGINDYNYDDLCNKFCLTVKT